jgi:hypothetical protein
MKFQKAWSPVPIRLDEAKFARFSMDVTDRKTQP